MNNQSLIDTTQDNFKNDDFLMIFQKTFRESALEFALILDEISYRYSSNLYWWISLTASRNSIKDNLYKEFCIVKSIQSFSKIYGKKFDFLVSTLPQKLVLEQTLGTHCPEIHINKRKESFRQSLKSRIRPAYFFINKLIHVLLIKLKFSKLKQTLNITLAEVFLSSTENYERYYPRLEKFLDLKKTKNIYFVPTIINSNFYNFFKIIKNIKPDSNNYFFRELYLGVNDLLDAVCYKTELRKLDFLNNNRNQSHYTDFDIMIFHSLKNEPFNSLSAEGILNFKFLKNLKEERNIKILNFIDWWENTPMDKGVNLALNSFFPETSIKGYMGFVPNRYSFQLYPSKQEILSKVVPKSIGVIGEAFLSILHRFDLSINSFLAPAFRFEHLKSNILKSQKYFLVLPSIYPDESDKMIEIILQIARFFPNINFVIKPHPGAGTLKKLQNTLNLKNIIIDNLSNVEKLLPDTRILITSSSSAALEGIVRSIPALILTHSASIPENIIPNSIPDYFWKSFNDIESLKSEIQQFLLQDTNSNTQKDTVKLNYYFNLPTNRNVHSFFFNVDE